MPGSQRKPSKATSGPLRRPHPRVAPAALLLALLAFSGCASPLRPRTVTVAALENGIPVEPCRPRRVIVADTERFTTLCYPLGQRLGLFQIRSPRDWAALRECAPQLGPCPDLRDGMVVGLASRAGLPLNGTWPINLETARLHDGAGFVTARFNGGSFLPDGTTYLETAQIAGLDTVLIVDVDGTRFYPR